ncbi:MAG TPA: nucleotide exchange factor GrpE [Candidatus Saccharimonadales bacterium]|nr:nucleotide exchange factor GrpE [Candidatus Saccharimonadales bacterium]
MSQKKAPHPNLAQLQQQVAELTEALQRERADATNLRRRHDEQIAGLKSLVKAGVVRDLLPVIDNFERALKHAPVILSGAKDLGSDSSAAPQNDDLRKYEEFIKGVQGVVKQFEKTLTDLGVERIATIGQPFDPRYHEAVSMEDGDGATEVVSEELQAGYKIGDEVIRHAMVRVKMA